MPNIQRKDVKATDSCFRWGHNLATCRAKSWSGPSVLFCCRRAGKTTAYRNSDQMTQPEVELGLNLTDNALPLMCRLNAGRKSRSGTEVVQRNVRLASGTVLIN